MRPFHSFLMAVALSLFCAVPATRASSVYFIGNSVTDGIRYDGVQAMAVSRGKTHSWGRHMIPGAPLSWIWDHPADGFLQDPYGLYPNALPNYTWDFLSLQPFDRDLADDLDYAQRFINLARGRAANASSMTTLVYSRYPRQDDAARAGGPRDYDTLWLRTYAPNTWDGSNESRDYFNKLTDSLRGVYGDNRIYMVPVGEVFYELNQRMKSGLIPGYTNIFELYKDGIHCSNVGSYVVGLTFFATLYRETPVGLAVPEAYNPDGAVTADRTITTGLAAALQSAVWDVVRQVTRSGVVDTALSITTASLPAARSNVAYSATLGATGGTSPYTFSLVSGALPAGITLGSNGTISGTTTANGTFSFRVRVTDSRPTTPATAERDLSLSVSENTIPTITTAPTLAGGWRGSRCERTLAASGGNGALSWSLVSGTLPPGVLLGGGGQLTGVATAEGTYAFTVRVADSDSPADTADRAFTITIGAPEAITAFPAKVTSDMRPDGALTETVWTLPQTAASTGLGTPDNTVTWQAVWDANYLHIAVKVLDSQLLRASATASANDDSVEIFLDAYNDKELFMNSQHRQFRIGLNGARTEVVGGRDAGVQSGVVLIPGGYTVEIAIPWTNLGVTGAANLPLGLDVAVNDNDGGTTRSSYVRFASASPTAPNPSQFGNLLLSAAEVSGTGALPAAGVSEAAAVYDGFEYAASAAIHGLSGGTGWAAGDAWSQQNSDTTSYSISDTASLNYTSGATLVTSGRGLASTGTYVGAGRALSMTALSTWKKSGSNAIGLDGAPELWLSYLVRMPATGSASVILENDGIPGTDNNVLKGLRIERNSSNGKWQLVRENGTTDVTADSNVTSVTNTTYLMVVRMRFGTSGTTDTIELFVNPTIGGATPTTPSATLSADIEFNQINFGPGGQILYVDEVRFGPGFAAVTPVPSVALAAPDFSTLPGIFTDALALALTTNNAGATIRYTTDGSAPTASSPAYSSALTLAKGTTTTVRAKAFKAGAVEGPEAGGTFVILSAIQSWLDAEGLDYATDVTTDPTGAGTPLLLRHAFGLSASEAPRTLTSGGSSGLPVGSMNAAGNLQIEFVRRRDGSRSYVIERGNSLSSWEQVATAALPTGLSEFTSYTITVSTIDANWDRVLFVEKPSSDTRRFLRVRVQ